MSLKELKEKYKEFEEVIESLREIDRRIALIDELTTVYVSSDSARNNGITFANDNDVGEIKTVALDILGARKVRVIGDGLVLMTKVKESLEKLKGSE